MEQKVNRLFDSLAEIEKKLQNSNAMRQNRQARRNKRSVKLNGLRQA